MSDKLNEDGLVAGQTVDFETLKRIQNGAKDNADAKPEGDNGKPVKIAKKTVKTK